MSLRPGTEPWFNGSEQIRLHIDKQKKEGQSLSGLTVKTPGSIVLVYIMWHRFIESVAYIWQETVDGEVTLVRLTRSSMWDMFVLMRWTPSLLANRRGGGGRGDSVRQRPSDECRIEILCHAEKMLFVLID